MAVVIDRVRGLYHFLGDVGPGNVPEVKPRPRNPNIWRKDGQVLVARVQATEDLKTSIDDLISMMGPLGKAITRGDRVLVKPNYNSADRFPGSTDPAFLTSVLEILIDAGARVVIGESAGGIWRPTRRVFELAGLYNLANKLGVGLIAFEDRADWVRVKVEGEYLHSLTMPRSAYEADRLVYVPCMKTHRLARYSGAMKLGFGFVHPGERRGFHMGHLEQKLAEVNLCWQPELIIQDGRKAFITGGPDSGQVAEPGVVQASGDLVALDVEAIGILLSYDADNRLPPDPWQLPQVKQALKYSLGSRKGEYAVVEKN